MRLIRLFSVDNSVDIYVDNVDKSHCLHFCYQHPFLRFGSGTF